MKKDLKGNYISQLEELLSAFDEQNSKQKTEVSEEKASECVEMYANQECLEAGTEISKPAEVAFMQMSSSSQQAHAAATISKPMHSPFKILLIVKNKLIVYHNVRISVLCQYVTSPPCMSHLPLVNT